MTPTNASLIIIKIWKTAVEAEKGISFHLQSDNILLASIREAQIQYLLNNILLIRVFPDLFSISL